MLKSVVASFPLKNDSKHIFKDVLLYSIHNKGTSNIEVFGITVLPGESFFKNSSGAASDLDCANIVFKGEPTDTKHVIIVRETLNKCN